MSVPAIVMMVVSIITVWGGLVAAVINLSRHPEATED
ncbi:methionine/alanine import family NSS transporter small subunit [Brachybacterium sp. J144]|nr:methionine/alanine import family NSS transporter small subunit [Brachybacterium sp. J144]MEE1650661.1 methionine/alanine import family NSS transporter small subunit [Brachybacterium sp. J144]